MAELNADAIGIFPTYIYFSWGQFEITYISVINLNSLYHKNFKFKQVTQSSSFFTVYLLIDWAIDWFTQYVLSERL